MKKLKIVLLLTFSAIWQGAFAAPSTLPTANPPIAAQNNPAAVIQSAIIKLNQLTLVAEHYPEAIDLLINKEVAPLFDFEHIAYQVLQVIRGRLSANETDFFRNKLKQNIIAALISKLTQSSATSFQFVFAKPTYNGNIIVRLQANGFANFNIYVDLLFHQDHNQNLKIFDIALNRDSLVNYYQRMVLLKIRRYGIFGMLERI